MSGLPAVAILADAHFHDPAGRFGEAGIDWMGQRRAWRSWADTEAGPRAVNESADALTAALAAIRRRGIRHVVLLGDLTDDGQVETTARLAAFLGTQTDLDFLALPGNHDLFAAHGKHTATRLASAPGRTRLVTSDPDLAAIEADAVLTPAMRCAGAPEALEAMAAFGLTRQPHHLHWESPFGLSDALSDRMFDATSADGRTMHRLIDASYLVEPVPDLWLLMLDANVFEPRPGAYRPTQKRAFLDPGDAGWTALLRVKPHLLHWTGDVAARAARLGKALLTLSHYPVLDPFEDADGLERRLFGQTATVRRTPAMAVADALIGAGVRGHFGGHLHVAGVVRQGPLAHVSVPSLVAWPPGFVVAHAAPGQTRVEFVPLDAPADPGLAAFYRAEGASGAEASFALRARLIAQRRAHVARRILPRDWPSALLDATLADHLPRAPEGTVADLAIDGMLLREGGPLTGAAIAPDRLALLRELAARFGDPAPQAATAEARFLARWLHILGQSLNRMDRGLTVTIGTVEGTSTQTGPFF